MKLGSKIMSLMAIHLFVIIVKSPTKCTIYLKKTLYGSLKTRLYIGHDQCIDVFLYKQVF
jgi:hypothetical protein